MESESRSARKLTSTTLFLATSIALQSIYQIHSTVASYSVLFAYLDRDTACSRSRRLVQNIKAAGTLQGLFLVLSEKRAWPGEYQFERTQRGWRKAPGFKRS